MWRYVWWARSKGSCYLRPGGRWTRQYAVSVVSGVLYLCGVPH